MLHLVKPGKNMADIEKQQCIIKMFELPPVPVHIVHNLQYINNLAVPLIIRTQRSPLTPFHIIIKLRVDAPNLFRIQKKRQYGT